MYSYTIFIMLLPLLSFLVLGLAGMKMQHKTAGLIGTCSLGIVTILSYTTAFQYFTAERVNGAFQTIVPYNYTWLPLGNLHFDMGILLDPISVMMLIVISTVSLMVASSRCRCWVWCSPRTSSRCICSGNSWVSAPTCSSVSTIR